MTISTLIMMYGYSVEKFLLFCFDNMVTKNGDYLGFCTQVFWNLIICYGRVCGLNYNIILIFCLIIYNLFSLAKFVKFDIL